MNQINNIPAMMTVPEFAEIMRVSKNTAYSFIKSGQIPYLKIGRQIRICRSDISGIISEIPSPIEHTA